MSRYRSTFARLFGTVIFGAILSVGLCSAEEPAGTDTAVAAAVHHSLESITDSELLDHVTFLAADAREGREAGRAGGLAAGDYLLAQIAALGLKPAGPDNQYAQPFQDGMRNILAILPGSDPELAKETVVIGAHYDHVGFGGSKSPAPGAAVYNGANDNASGVAGVLEIAEALSQLPQAPRRSVLFALWDGEEKGLLGSRYFVEHPTVEIDGIVFAIALDMIGRIEKDHFVIWGTGTAVGLRELIARQNVAPQLNLEFRVFNLVLSDHEPFFMKNIPAILPSSGLFPELHRPTDDVELINADGMRRASQLICGLVLELANRDERLEFAEVSKSEADRNPARTADPATPRSDDTGFQLGFTCQREPREPNAVIVVRVAADTPAALAGLQSGDRIHSINQVNISQLDPSLSSLKETTNSTSLSIERNGTFLTLTLDSQAGTPRIPGPYEPSGLHHTWSKTSAAQPSGNAAATITDSGNAISADDAVEGSVILGYTDGRTPQIAFSPGGQLLATDITAAGSLLRLWNLNDSQLTPISLHHDAQHQTESMRFSEDARRLVTVRQAIGGPSANAMARQMQLIDLPDGALPAQVHQLDTPAVTYLRDFAHQHWIGSNSPDGLRLWNLEREEPLANPIFIHTSRIGRRSDIPMTSLSDDGRWLTTCRELIDQTKYNGEALEFAMAGSPGPNTGLFSGDGKWALAGNRLFDLSAPDPLENPTELPLTTQTTTAQFSPNGHYLATITRTMTTIWNLTQDNPLEGPQEVAGSSAPPVNQRFAQFASVTPQFTADSRRVLLTEPNGAIKIIDLDTAKVHEIAVAAARTTKRTLLSKNGRWLVASDRQGVQLWDLEQLEGTEPTKLLDAPLRNQSRVLIASPDGRWLTVSSETPVRFWDLTADQPSRATIVLPESSGPVEKFSPDGRWLITAPFPRNSRRILDDRMAQDAWLNVWDLTAAQPSNPVLKLSGHKGWAVATEFSPNGHWLVTYGCRLARLWDLSRN